MPKLKTKKQFISDASRVHNGIYGYSNVNYVNSKTKVSITCYKHGNFMQTPNDHLRGRGCPICAKRKTPVGKGLLDSIQKHISYTKAYRRWNGMLQRCYGKSLFQDRINTYKECFVCDDWHKFSNFKKWFDENYVEGYHLDKDILFKGNKKYSPETCCFVPIEINSLFTKRQNKRGELPIGVGKVSKSNKFQSNLDAGCGKRIYLGVYDTPEEAFQAYKKAKEEWIKEVANKWKGKIAPNVYEALMNYQVEITD